MKNWSDILDKISADKKTSANVFVTYKKMLPWKSHIGNQFTETQVKSSPICWKNSAVKNCKQNATRKNVRDKTSLDNMLHRQNATRQNIQTKHRTDTPPHIKNVTQAEGHTDKIPRR